MNTLKKILLLITVISISLATYAEEVEFVASAQSTVIAGQPFQLVYSINENAKDLRLPEIKGFDIIAGPYTSTSSSTQWINGKMTSSKEVRYTYTLLADKEGNYTIPSASIVVKREKYYSNILNIKVLPEDKASAQQQNSGQNSSGQVQQTQSISSDNLFIRPIVSRTRVKEQESIVLTYRLYSRVDVIDIQSPKFPDFKGFLVQEIELPQDRRMEPEHYNGVNYYTFDLRKVLLFPQTPEDITIDRMSCDIVVRVRNQQRVRSFFDDFFDTYQEVSKPVHTSRLQIHVDPLPQPKPHDFSGVVGHLSVSSHISETEIDANQPITLKLTIKGNGNLKMLKTPKLDFPTDFEAYEPKVVNNISTNSTGMTGSKTIEYLIIPRHDGEFTIPSATLSYYDTSSNSYKKLSTQSFNVKVNKGAQTTDNTQAVVANFQNQEKVELLASDIRYINTDPLQLKEENEYIVGTVLFWMAYLIPLIITALLIFFFRKKARDNANVALMRNKKANKVARKRLKIAEKQWKEGNKEPFYDEILKALWGYLSDKLSMPVSELNKDNISAKLTTHAVSQEIIDSFMKLLNDCEFERYAPMTDTKSAMDKIYESTVDLISTLENTIKK